ncbi:MAG: protocatechuate 3,4-dioxygenase subunit alpha [Alphaproteobacteria bacterium]|nr:protocatechuate 3,4-dioxygenase subunit alpha [Alphaproteobacteria bacterium]
MSRKAVAPAARGLTPSQTVGPYFAYALTPAKYRLKPIIADDLVTPDAEGERIRIEGRVLDADGKPVSDALIEIWQADGKGRYPAAGSARSNAAFKGFGRAASNGDGRYAFATVKPGPVPGPNRTMQAPHVSVSVLARGVLKRLHTRIYFDGEPGNARDPILALVPASRRATLIAKRAEATGAMPCYVLDIRLQGSGETVFFAS